MMNIDVAKKRLSHVLRIDSIDSTDSDFLATHVPFRKISVRTSSGDHSVQNNKSEEEIYKEIFNNISIKNDHQFIIVEGSSGAGKSHFIRWIYAMLSSNGESDDVVLLIRRGDNTLKGTIRQLLEIKEVKEIANKEAYERLVKANQAITENKFKSTIYHRFIVEIENDTSEILSSIKRKKLIALLNNSIFQDRLMSSGGPIERIYSKITSSSYEVNLDLVAQFNIEDMTLDVDFVNQLDDADKKARDFANSLMEGDDIEFIKKITDYLNSFIETVIQSSAGIEPGDFQQIFKEIRQELKHKGKNFILLVEDITSFTGINQALLNALVTGHTGSNVPDNLCRLISIVGTTSEYYRQFRDNYRDRITKQISIQEGIIGDNKNDLIQFVAKYLNAVSLETTVLDEWVKSGAYADEIPVYDDSEHDYWDSFLLDSKKKVSLFPFTKNSIVNLYLSMPSQKTPRYILRDIVEPALNEVIYDKASFPKFCLGWRTSIPESVENRIGNIVSYINVPNEVKADYRKRLVAFVGFWTNKTLDVTDDGCIAGVKTKVYMEFAFNDFVSQLTSTATVKITPVKPVYNHAFEYLNPLTGESSLTKAIPFPEEEADSVSEPVTAPIINQVKPELFKIDPKNQNVYDSFKENVIAWHRDGGNLIRFVPIREQICKFVYDSINWQQEGVPLDSKKRFMDAVGHKLIGFERQDQAIDKCIVIFPDSNETYQLLLCFGKWLYLGNKSWCFPGAASAVYFATSWLEKNKDKFVSVIRNTNKTVLPVYIKAAMIQQIYKRIINGSIANVKSSNHFNFDTFLDADCQMNNATSFIHGHSSSWYDLQKFIFNDSSNSEAYISSVRYFNLIQGNQINSENFVLNYQLYQDALKELSKSSLSINENEFNEIEDAVKEKREIIEFTVKIEKKLHQVAVDETQIARKTAVDVLNFFENIGIEDEIEERDIRMILNNIFEFYQKAISTGVSISSITKDDINGFKNKASDIATAMNKLQNDYSNKNDIDIVYEFSTNPIGMVLPFLNLLKRVNIDVDNAEKMMNSEKENLTKKGIWSKATDPRFDGQRNNFNILLTAFEEV